MVEQTPNLTSSSPIFENGVANTTHPSIQSFFKTRDLLIEQESSHRSGIYNLFQPRISTPLTPK